MLSNRPAALAVASALVLTAAVAALLLRVPLPFQDNTLLTLPLQRPAGALFVDTMNQAGFLRPASRATSKLVFDAAPGREFLAFRAIHIAMVLVLLAALVSLLRVDTALGCGLAALALVAVIGMHPFHEAVRETDLNIKLIVPALCAAVAAAAAAARAAWWRDAAVLLLLVYAVAANELGLLLWVCLAAAYLVGFRGVSGTAVAGATVLVAGYLVLRFTYLGVGAPALTERGSGFGFRTFEPPELQAMFGDNALPYYAYNIVASVMSVLFSEPRGGVFVLARELLSGSVETGTLLNVITSAVTTGVLAWYAVRRWRSWRGRTLAHDDRLFLVAAAVIAANAVISYPYLKDVTMSTGAAFYPVAMFAALRLFVTEHTRAPQGMGRVLLASGVLLVVSVGWTVRGAAFAVDMRQESVRLQRDWSEVYERLAEQQTPLDEIDRPFTDRFRQQMLRLTDGRTAPAPRWLADLDPH